MNSTKNDDNEKGIVVFVGVGGGGGGGSETALW